MPPILRSDAGRGLVVVEDQLRAIERQMDATGECLSGDERGQALDRLVTGLGVLDEYLTTRSSSIEAIHEAANALLNGSGGHLLVLSDERSVLQLDTFPVIDDALVWLEDGADRDVLIRWALLVC